MLVEQAHDLISAHTTDDRNLFLYASDAFQRILGINTQVNEPCRGFCWWLGLLPCFRVQVSKKFPKKVRRPGKWVGGLSSSCSCLCFGREARRNFESNEFTSNSSTLPIVLGGCFSRSPRRSIDPRYVLVCSAENALLLTSSSSSSTSKTCHATDETRQVSYSNLSCSTRHRTRSSGSWRSPLTATHCG